MESAQICHEHIYNYDRCNDRKFNVTVYIGSPHSEGLKIARGIQCITEWAYKSAVVVYTETLPSKCAIANLIFCNVCRMALLYTKCVDYRLPWNRSRCHLIIKIVKLCSRGVQKLIISYGYEVAVSSNMWILKSCEHWSNANYIETHSGNVKPIYTNSSRLIKFTQCLLPCSTLHASLISSFQSSLALQYQKGVRQPSALLPFIQKHNTNVCENRAWCIHMVCNNSWIHHRIMFNSTWDCHI